jgi:photosystem II stability/assembly factor-like uncharacterized protein
LDGGRTWAPNVDVGTYGDVRSLYAGPAVRFADARHGWIYGQGAFATDDGGRTWHDTGLVGHVYGLEPAGGSVWLLLGCDSDTCPDPPALLTSAVGSRTWVPLASQPPLGAGSASMVRLTRDHVLVWQRGPRMLETTDGGHDWRGRPFPCHDVWSEGLATLDGVTIWVVCGSQPGAGNQLKEAYLSRDSGRTWRLTARDYPTAIGSIAEGGYVSDLGLATSGNAFLALDRGGLLRSVDGGVTWRDTSVFDPAGTGVSNIWFVDARHGWVVDTDGLLRTIDGGATWSLEAASPA